MECTYRMYRAVRIMRDELDKKDVPAYWLEFLLLVHNAGEKGITTKEVSEELGMTQGIASRMVKMMGKYQSTESETVEGYGILHTMPDLKYRHRQRVYFTQKGRDMMSKVVKALCP